MTVLFSYWREYRTVIDLINQRLRSVSFDWLKVPFSFYSRRIFYYQSCLYVLHRSLTSEQTLKGKQWQENLYTHIQQSYMAGYCCYKAEKVSVVFIYITADC